MSPITKNILIGGASALIGFACGHFVTKKWLETKYQKIFEEEVNKEIEEIRKYNERCEKEKEDSATPYTNIEGNILKTIDCHSRESFSSENEYRAYITSICYKQWEREGISDEEMNRRMEMLEAELEHPEEEEEELVEPEDHQLQDDADAWEKRPPQILNSEDFGNLPPIFSYVKWTFYEQDETLVAEGEDVIYDEMEYVGDALECFGVEAEELTGDPDLLFVVCGSHGLAIEIRRVEGSYYDVTGG